MPKILTSSLIESLTTLMKIVKKDGLAQVTAVISIIVMTGFITGFIPIPWAKIEAKQEMMIEAIDQVKAQHSAMMSRDTELIQQTVKQTQATVANCKITARANGADPRDCDQ